MRYPGIVMERVTEFDTAEVTLRVMLRGEWRASWSNVTKNTVFG